jgi:GAF domain-containing protein
MAIDPDQLHSSLNRLRGDPELSDDLAAAMVRVADATRVLFGSDGAGVMLIDDERALSYVHSNEEGARRLEAAQRELGHGPCVDCLVLDHTVETPDIMEDHRWPGLAVLLEGSGVRAVLGVPVRLAGGAIGSLNVHRRQPCSWDPEETAAIAAYARVIEDLIGAALIAQQKGQLVDQLEHALDNRVVIERAIGFLMASDRLNAVDAFDRLRRQARSERRKVIEIATDLVGAR